MHTVINSIVFQKKVEGKYTDEYIDEIANEIAFNTNIGKKLITVNNIYKIGLGDTIQKKGAYNLYYYCNSKKEPILLINIYKKKEKDIITKLINDLVVEALR